MNNGCIKCGAPVEDFGDGEPSDHCPRCNDRLIERSNKWREWHYYHPGEPCPESELE